MSGTLSVLSILLLAIAAQAAPPPRCAVTQPPRRVFVPPPPYEASPGESDFYFGSDDFWTTLPNNGVWETQHDQPTYDMRKIAWYSLGYWWLREPDPDLTMDARRLDGSGESVRAEKSNNAFIPERQMSAMLNSIEFPTTGCWEISARYHTHYLKFVVWVTPYIASSN
jgi:hypothetical protein